MHNACKNHVHAGVLNASNKKIKINCVVEIHLFSLVYVLCLCAYITYLFIFKQFSNNNQSEG